MGRLLGVMGLHLSPWGVHWMDAFGGHWGSLVVSLLESFDPFENSLTQVSVCSDFLYHSNYCQSKKLETNPNCENISVFVCPNGLL